MLTFELNVKGYLKNILVQCILNYTCALISDIYEKTLPFIKYMTYIFLQLFLFKISINFFLIYIYNISASATI